MREWTEGRRAGGGKDGRAEGRAGGVGGMAAKKLEPHTEMWGKSVSHLFLLYILLTLPAVVGMRPLDSFDGRFECVTF